MGKIKIIAGIIVLAALVIGGYFYLQNRQSKIKEPLFGSISTTFKQPDKEDSRTDTTEKIDKPFDSGQTEEIKPLVGLSSKTIAFENPTEIIFHPESGTESEIQEQISKPEIPSQISERRFKPIVPPPPVSEPPVILATTKNTEEEQEDEEEPEEPAATSTPAVSPVISIFFSDYSITSRQFSVNWQSSSTDILTYDIEIQYGFGDWQNWLASTTATSTVFQVPHDLMTYYFRASATNISNLTSDWQEIEAPIYFYPVVINEIAWAGTGTSSKATADEWIELYNKSNYSVNLNSWLIAEGKDATTTVVALQGQINAHDYYLIERTDDITVSDVTADLAKSFGGSGLSNSGENLRLVDEKDQIIDIVDCSGGWLAGKAAPDYRSMERVNPYLVYDIPGNWQSNSTSSRNGLNVDGQPVNGTPRAQNSVFDLEFFYLYAPPETNATSTKLKWTESFLPDLNDYKIIRSYNNLFSSASTTIVAATTSTDFIDETLESETGYYYKISACDLTDYSAPSNIASTTTSAFPFLWSEPQLIYEISTSTPDDQIFD